MKFSFFHLMPWTHTEDVGGDWPISNRMFDPEQGAKDYQTYIDQMSYAEECGFDLVGCNEHHYSPYGLMANPNLVGGALSQRTKKIRLAMMGNLVPMLNPIRVAEEYAMLDVMSGGRLVAGLIRGIPHEYAAYNMAGDESWPRFREAVELIIKAWTEPEPFGWDGEYYQYKSVSIWPRPLQQPHPPILMSASSPESARFAAKNRASMGIVNFTSLEQPKAIVEVYKDAALEHGWRPQPGNILVGAPTCIAEDDEEARAYMTEAAAFLHGPLSGGPRTASRLVLQKTRYYSNEETAAEVAAKGKQIRNLTVQDRIDAGSVLCGSPEMVVQQIRRLHREVGHGVMNLNFKTGNMPNDVVRRGMQLFKERVLPEVQDLGVSVDEGTEAVLAL